MPAICSRARLDTAPTDRTPYRRENVELAPERALPGSPA